jgi:hypothetical protein
MRMGVQVSNDCFDVVVMDGEEVYVVRRDMLEHVELAHLSEHVGRVVRWMRDFVGTHPQFSLARHTIGVRRRELWLLIYDLCAEPQRVHVERLRCSSCSSIVWAANPTVTDLYFGLPREVEWTALKNAWTLPHVPCPRCACELPRRAIWAELA